jgi:hypothetical protein
LSEYIAQLKEIEAVTRINPGWILNNIIWNFMKSDAIFKKYLTAEHAEIAEII